ncbi:hypothetical protein BGX23_008812, partial [Mortierella sp. AD031]
VFITLDDVLERPWAFSKLTHLSLGIGGCKLPVEPGTQLYYSRPHPIALSDPETKHFDRLEELHRRIGQHTDLEHLSLTLVPLDEHGLLDEPAIEERRLFSAMLSLGNVWSGRPRHLDHLAGLSKLKYVSGSVSEDTEEGKATIGWKEAV